eukprot:COSAG02_NODE_1460_length_12494_cov_126.207422_5_plen_222_part_00
MRRMPRAHLQSCTARVTVIRQASPVVVYHSAKQPSAGAVFPFQLLSPPAHPLQALLWVLLRQPHGGAPRSAHAAAPLCLRLLDSGPALTSYHHLSCFGPLSGTSSPAAFGMLALLTSPTSPTSPTFCSTCIHVHTSRTRLVTANQPKRPPPPSSSSTRMIYTPPPALQLLIEDDHGVLHHGLPPSSSSSRMTTGCLIERADREGWHCDRGLIARADTVTEG